MYMKRISELEKRIFDAAGCEFNVFDSKQVQEVLYERLKLPRERLSKLAADHRIAADILEFKHLVAECEKKGIR